MRTFYNFRSAKGSAKELADRFTRAGHSAIVMEDGVVQVLPFGNGIKDEYFDEWVNSMERHFKAEYVDSVPLQ